MFKLVIRILACCTFLAIFPLQAQPVFFGFEPSDAVEPAGATGFFDASSNPNIPCKGGEAFGQCRINDFTTLGVEFVNFWAASGNNTFPASSGGFNLKNYALADASIEASGSGFTSITMKLSTPGVVNIFVNGSLFTTIDSIKNQSIVLTETIVGASIVSIRFNGAFVSVDELSIDGTVPIGTVSSGLFSFEPGDPIELALENSNLGQPGYTDLGFFDANSQPKSPCKGNEPFGQCKISDFANLGIEFVNAWAAPGNSTFPATDGRYVLKTYANSGTTTIQAIPRPNEKIKTGFGFMTFTLSSNTFVRMILKDDKNKELLSKNFNTPQKVPVILKAEDIGQRILSVSFEGGFVSIDELGIDADTDGDGLLDQWEINGIDVNEDGLIDLDLAALGANPLHKDLFVEIDAMQNRSPMTGALSDVTKAFKNAPVSNPDNIDGIELHLQLDETNISRRYYLIGFNSLEFDWDKSNHFGTQAQRNDSNSQNIIDAKKLVYRYCIFADTYGINKSSGRGETPGNDFFVTLGNLNPVGGTREQQAATFMHELGHNLNLKHGGGDDINYKPNYYSVMNYYWQLPQTYNQSWHRLDFSSVELEPLNENALDEKPGIYAKNSVTDLAKAKAWVYINPTTNKAITFQVVADGQWSDFNGDYQKTTTQVAADLNYIFPNDSPSPGQILEGHDDWGHILLPLGGHVNYEDGVHLASTLPEEIDEETMQFLSSLPAPVQELTGDLDLDGDVDMDDLNILKTHLNQPSSGPGDIYDINADGTINVSDMRALTLLCTRYRCSTE